MIPGFEKYTKELTDDEWQLLPVFVESLKHHVGKAQAITNAKMREAMAVKMGTRVSDARVRKIIAFIRRHNMIPTLISYGSKGYAVADSREELVRGIASILSRAHSIHDVATAMMEYNDVSYDEIQEYYAEVYGDEEIM